MATNQGTIDFIVEQLGAVPHVTARKMFGEYALYVGTKVVALICDDILYLKPTPSAKELMADPVEGHPYPGAKWHFVVTDELDDPDRLAKLITRVAADLPEPKPKKPKAKKPAT
jgi:DNA transformation protein